MLNLAFLILINYFLIITDCKLMTTYYLIHHSDTKGLHFFFLNISEK